MENGKDSVVVVGAGMGGLAAAMRLAAAGRAVTLCDAHPWPGGKMRQMPSAAGPVDAGPTVLTLRDVLAQLFHDTGASLDVALDLQPLPELARHFWPDGTRLDLGHSPEANAAAIEAAFGARARQDFLRFSRATAQLFQAFDGPIMRSPQPRIGPAARAALMRPAIWPWLAPGRSLHSALRASFRQPKLRQLFGRYATYVGGNPLLAPAVLGLVWQAEAQGVWAVRGGMAALAQALARRFVDLGGQLRLGTGVQRILHQGGRVAGVCLADGSQIAAHTVVFNGDPLALPALLGAAPRRPKLHPARSLSARVWTFAAQVAPTGLGRDALGYHSVFFADDEAAEFQPLSRNQTPSAPTIYVCAQDRLDGTPDGPERFQMILNAPAVAAQDERTERCQNHPLARLRHFGLQMGPWPQAAQLTTPAQFAQLFPASQGALYGQSPNSTWATFQRPQARTGLAGLYLAGGGVHPGAGVPMALLSGQHAAQAVQSDQISPARSRRMAMRGGMSTVSATAARGRFL